jgi:hypothetical protein
MAGIKFGRVTNEIDSIMRNAKSKKIADSGSDAAKDKEISDLRATKASAMGLKKAQASAPDVTSTESEATTKAKKVNDRKLYQPMGTEGEGVK